MNPQQRKTEPAARRQRLFVGTILGLAITGLLAAYAQFGFAQPEKKKAAQGGPGLRGILPNEVPDALVLEEFDKLGKPYAEWTKAVYADLTTLYEGENTGVADQRKAIASLRKLMAQAAADVQSGKAGKVRDGLVSLRGRILRRIDVAEAALDTLAADPVASRKARIAGAWPAVTTALNRLQRHLNEYAGGSNWMGYVYADKIRAAAKAGHSGEPALKMAADRIANRGKLAKDQAAFLSEKPFLNLYSALTELNKLHSTPPVKVNIPKLRAQLKKLVSGLEQYEATNASAAAKAVRSAYDAITGLSGDGGDALNDALRTHYYNYNVRIYVAEPLLNRIVGRTRTEQGNISDQVLGASVYGNQTTTTTVGVDLKPSNSYAKFNITLNGVTQTNTVGVTDQANVYTSGYHTIWATKEVRFDGDKFYTNKPARVSVNANNNTFDAETNISWIPLLGLLADDYAVKVANSKRGESEAIARQKIADEVSDKLDKEVDKQFAKVNKSYKDNFLKTLEEDGLKPGTQSVRSTDDLLLISSRVMNPGELGGDQTNISESLGWGLTVRVHESAINNAFDRLNVAGRTLTEDELNKEITKTFDKLVKDKNKKEEKPKKKKSTDKFVFAKQDPIRFRIRGGSLAIILRTGLKSAGREDIPTQVITIPVTLSASGKKILVKRGTVGVAPAEKPDNAAKQIARAGIMRNKIEEAIGDREFDGILTFGGKDTGSKEFKLTVSRITTINGWLSLWAK